MAKFAGDDSWIYKLGKDDLIAELEIRGLPGTGSLPVLRVRLMKFEREKNDENKTLDPVEETSEGSKISDEGPENGNALKDRSSEVISGGKCFEVPNVEISRESTDASVRGRPRARSQWGTLLQSKTIRGSVESEVYRAISNL